MVASVGACVARSRFKRELTPSREADRGNNGRPCRGAANSRIGRPMSEDFYRIQRLPPYVFAEVNAMKAAARARGEDVVDLGMGKPDGAPPAHVIAQLAEVAATPNAHRYSASRGIPGLRKAQASYYQRRFGVSLDPDSEVIVTLG